MNKSFYKKYSYKIKTINELKKIIGKFNKRKKTISMCHGVFDVVHPGHIRHLFYAKNKSDLLIVSITKDKFIKKGTYRPHVPENLRAANLASLEMVDFVTIDQDSKPLKNIKFIQPDFFAKGFEYGSKKINQDTKEEIEALKTYGGKIMFTPGDVVYSSSKILEGFLPSISYEKLSDIMQINNLNLEKLKNIIKNFNKYKVHVVGDVIIDIYTKTKLNGGQVKSPTISVLKERDNYYLGGAGVVAKHLSAAGADVTITTVVGKDKNRNYVKKELNKYKIKSNLITDTTRPTTTKNAIVFENYKLLKIDNLDNRPVSPEIINKIRKLIRNLKSHSVVISDFRHGIFTKSSSGEISNSISKKIFKVADSQVASRWGNITEFKNFDLICPNEREARFALADQDSTVGNLSTNLELKTKFKNLIMKLGSRGILCSTSNKNSKSSYFNIDSFVENLIDPVGAGDALLAYATLTMLDTKNLAAAGIIGSLAAACECEMDGNTPVTTKKIFEKIDKIKKNFE